MNTISTFLNLSLDGCYAGPHGEIDWFKSIAKDDAYDAYTHGAAKSGSTLVFGRTTYAMMKSYWPTPVAKESDPEMARVMNESPKLVFSKTLDNVDDWKHVELVRTLDRNDILRRKQQTNLTILGSGSIVQQFANLGLIDAYMLVVLPLIIGEGKRLFDGVRQTNMKLREARSFGNGVVVVQYATG